jgi:hypothetical protein
VKLNIEHALLDSMLLTGRGRRVFSCNYRLAGTDFQLNRPEILSYRRDYLLLLSDGSVGLTEAVCKGQSRSHLHFHCLAPFLVIYAVDYCACAVRGARVRLVL